MIELVPFYLSPLAKIHKEERDGDNNDQNRRYSLSLLNSLLPVIADYVTSNSNYSMVISTPSPRESQVICSYLIRHFNEHGSGSSMLNLIRFCDLRPERIVDEKGIHVISVPNAERHLVSCEILISYFPLPPDRLKGLYLRSRKLVLFKPLNSDTDYHHYIQLVTDIKTGVRK